MINCFFLRTTKESWTRTIKWN